MACPICERRKAKRYCPAKGAQICSRCCGAEREVRIDCPFECPYLQESREHDYKEGLNPQNFPYKEVRIDESFLRDHAKLLETLGRELLQTSLGISGAVDGDARQALEALAETYKTLDSSGLYYETRPVSAFAQAIVDRLQRAAKEFREQENQELGFARTRDGDLLRLWVFLYRMALDRDNGRPRGKAFLDFLRLHFRLEDRPQESLIVPGV